MQTQNVPLHWRPLVMSLTVGCTMALIMAVSADAASSRTRATPARVCHGTEAATRAERGLDKGAPTPISSYDDDPFAADAVVECLAAVRFGLDADGQAVLRGPVAGVEDPQFG
jgi:hypothetical protein